MKSTYLYKKIILIPLLFLFLLGSTGCITGRDIALGNLTETNSRRVNDPQDKFSLILPGDFLLTELTDQQGTRGLTVVEGEQGEEGVIFIQESDISIRDIYDDLAQIDGQTPLYKDDIEIGGFEAVKAVFQPTRQNAEPITVYLIDTNEKNYSITGMGNKDWSFFDSVVQTFQLVEQDGLDSEG